MVTTSPAFYLSKADLRSGALSESIFWARGRREILSLLARSRAGALRGGHSRRAAFFLGLRPGLLALGAGDLAEPERQQATGVPKTLTSSFWAWGSDP